MQYDVRLTIEFAAWLDTLTDQIAAAAVAERLLRIRRGLFGDHVSVGDRVSELRIHHGAGYRAYFTVRDRTIIFMLAGGTKRTQKRDIERAKNIEQQL
jgi:putative addiction module killer protein